MKENLVVHDVGAANFIPPHLLVEDAVFIHFEPDPRGREGLERFYNATGFKPRERVIRSHALGKLNEQLELCLSTKNTGSSFKTTSHDGEKLLVDVKAAEDLIRSGEVTVPNLIKIDVEGFERDVLAGYDLSRPEICCIEVEVTLEQAELGNIINLLTQAGFSLAKLIQHGDQFQVQPTKMQKRVHRWLKRVNGLLATDGNALNGMSALSTPLVQLELVFTRFNGELPDTGTRIQQIYGLCSRDKNGRLNIGGINTGLISNWRFWR